MTSFSRAALLGAVQGVTEFLPISSDGHLTLFQAALGGSSTDLAMDVALHLGTLGSILLFFSKDIIRMVRQSFSPMPSSERALERRRLGYILLATIPTAVIGLGLKSTVEYSVSSFRAAGFGFLITAVFLAAASRVIGRIGRPITLTPWWNAIVLGLIQGAAVWPGLSRSGSTIATALLLGWSWREAGKFSFLMAIPAIAGAVLLTARDAAQLEIFPVVTGMFVAFAVGCAALWLLMRFLAAGRLWPFAVYCALAGTYALSRSF